MIGPRSEVGTLSRVGLAIGDPRLKIDIKFDRLVARCSTVYLYNLPPYIPVPTKTP